MENPKAPQTTVADSEGEVSANTKGTTDAQNERESLVAKIKEQAQAATAKCEDIEQMWLLAERAKTEIDSHIVPTREGVAAITQQTESARARAAEITAIAEGLQATNRQASEAAEQATAATEALRRLEASANESAKAAAAKNEEIERARVYAESTKAEMDSQMVSMREAVATLNQHAESAKSQVAEVRTLLDSVQATNAQTKETSLQTTAALESLRTLANAASEGAARIEALRTQVEQAAQVAAQRSQHIEEGREYVDKKRGEIDVISNTAQLSANNAEAHNQASQTTAEKINNVYTSAQATLTAANSNSEIVEKFREQCEQHTLVAKQLADAAQTTEQKIAAYEARLAELERNAAEQLRAPKKMTRIISFGTRAAGDSFGKPTFGGGVPWLNHLSAMPFGNESNRCYRHSNDAGGVTPGASRSTGAKSLPGSSSC